MQISKRGIENNIYNLIKSNMEKVPERIALLDSENEISYGMLKLLINTFASRYMNSLQRQDIVVLYLNKGNTYVVAMLAAMSLGVVYIPLDKNCPKGRLNKICEQSDAKLLITDEKLENCACKYMVIDGYKVEGTINVPNNMGIEPEGTYFAAGSELAYTIFTSGSSGVPKGIMIECGNLFNLVMALHRNIYKNERYLVFAVIASFAFDSSIKQIFSALCFGHTLVIISDIYKKNPNKLLKILNEYKVDVLDATPSYMSLLNSVKKINYHELKYLLFGGENLTLGHVRAARNIFGNMVNLYNLYGPSECCVDVSFYKIPIHITSSAIPIGHPLDNIVIEIDSADGGKREGEIIISGACVGRGYINVDKGGFYTDEYGNRKYRTGDWGYIENGLLYFMGRIDDQIKLNGNRGELSEIDAFLLEQTEISFSFTVMVEISKYKFIVSFYKDSRDNQNTLLEQLKEYLPDYLIPKRLIRIEDIQYTVNGKADKKYYENKAMEVLVNNGKNN